MNSNFEVRMSGKLITIKEEESGLSIMEALKINMKIEEQIQNMKESLLIIIEENNGK